ncbi:MAG: Holliday junction resolvase RuvX [Clostridia bacterium]|nr:Holliday junction resolvase RuvX [Clostridia bacterium]
MSKILSVDYGDARTGIAVSDESRFLSSPVCVISERNTEKLLHKVADKANELAVGLIVVGYPKNMNGTVGERAEKCAEFARRLSEESGIETVLWDERCTTMSASVYMNYTDTRGKKRKQQIDAAAANIILQDYLDFRNNHSRE